MLKSEKLNFFAVAMQAVVYVGSGGESYLARSLFLLSYSDHLAFVIAMQAVVHVGCGGVR